jgi:hypothetical protein
MLFSNGRAYYRVVYPERERPTFIIAGRRLSDAMPVIDCSERGIRYEIPLERLQPDQLPAVDDKIRGRVRFRDGTEIEIEGTVVRVAPPAIALKLQAPGVPLSVIFAEQRYLRTHYPAWLESRPSRPAG